MTLEQSIQQIQNQVKELRKNTQMAEKNKLPGNTYFLPDESALCLPRGDGEARYPYSHDGFTLWAGASGTMYAGESTFTVFQQMTEGNEPKIAFFAGFEKENGSFEPISLLGVPAHTPALELQRYTVYTPSAVYYFTETEKADFAVRVFMTEEKEIFFSVHAVNKLDKPLKLYLSSYWNPLLIYGENDNAILRWYRSCRATEDGFAFSTTQYISRNVTLSNYGILNKYGNNILSDEQTTSRINFMGGKNSSFAAAKHLYTGTFEHPVPVCGFSDIAIAGDLSHYELEASSTLRLDFRFAVTHHKEETAAMCAKKYLPQEIDAKLETLKKQDQQHHEKLQFRFSTFEDGSIRENVFNVFLNYIKRQIELCALGKNYAGDLLGVRDVMQQLEALVLWRPEACADKILEALSYTAPNGRCPRQYSIPAEGAVPKMDLRPYIDQGVWVISTIATYLRYTKDFAFLKRTCGYYDIVDEDSNLVRKSDLEDTVLDHMLKIMNYLLSKRDMEQTKCVRALYGDWNDALDGLGISSDPKKKYGTGVSVMATLQVYQNLEEMIELLSLLDRKQYADTIEEYEKAKEEITEGLKKYAIVRNEEGRMHILHGWGDKRSYLVGGFSDSDGAERYGLTASAFWVLSGFYQGEESIRQTILESYRHLDSKYGLMTFDKPFAPKTPGVGRIGDLPAGTAENAAAYIHGSMFGIASLFKMGESAQAWKQLAKSIPITHANVSLTPFVMPNSYCYNETLGIDGQSMGDWHTGSANVLLKTLMRYAIGIEPQFDGVMLQPAASMPVKAFEVQLEIRGCAIHYSYRNEGTGQRRFLIDGKEQTAAYDPVMRLPRLKISDEAFRAPALRIEVLD